MPQENRPETVREAELMRQIAQKDRHIKQLHARLQRRDQPQPPSTPRPPSGSFDGDWMGG